MGWREDTIAWYRHQIGQMQGIELMEGGILTVGEAWEGGRIEDRSAELIADYRKTIGSLKAALADLEGRQA